MRLGGHLLGALLAIVLVASGASAHLGAVHVETSADEATSTPACVPTCEVQTTSYGNLPAVTVVENGTNVTWTALQGYHTVTSDDGVEDKRTTLVYGGSTDPEEGCLHSQVFENATVAFRVNGSQLEAYDWSAEEPSWQACEEAIGTAEGGFLLSYHCNVHPRNQNSALLVVPER